ncbi:MAG: LuxR family transcriptional regulator [Limisphaerales bacterium]|nr:MAG: LuxR family transcriptional regulator [Limisphaerales bacterium]KAG0510328.1 MAG: LuxR family transcriptional regulator [Limisphaerales bacterium]TXT51515.1 MAG: LuxR family transcriptional regulator [Limisphaerales bacterium]
MSARITISLVEDHEDTREVLRRSLARQPDFAVLDEFADAESALSRVSARLPHIVLVDWHLGEGRMDGLEFIRCIKALHPGLCCLLITAYDLEHLPIEAVRSGADGFIYKSDSLASLPRRIRAAHAGEFPFSPRAAGKVVSIVREEAAAARVALKKLTAREREILLFMRGGPTEKQAAAHFGLSAKTIHNHLNSAHGKLGVHNRAEALALLRGDRMG